MSPFENWQKRKREVLVSGYTYIPTLQVSNLHVNVHNLVRGQHVCPNSIILDQLLAD